MQVRVMAACMESQSFIRSAQSRPRDGNVYPMSVTSSCFILFQARDLPQRTEIEGKKAQLIVVIETKQCGERHRDETKPRTLDSSKSRKNLTKPESVLCVVKHYATGRAYLGTSELTLVKNLINAHSVDRDLHKKGL